MRQAQQLQKQVTKMQEDLANAQKELETEEVEASSGGGVVTVVITGKLKIKSINIEPEATEEIEMLQDLVTAAVNEAIETAQKLRQYTDRPIVVRTHSGMGHPTAKQDITKLYENGIK